MRRKTPLALMAVAILAVCLAAPQPALALRIVTYNVLNFPGSTGAARLDDFRAVLEEIDPDVLVVQEMLSETGMNQILNDALNYYTPGVYAAGPFVNGYDTDNALYYKIATVDYVSHQEISTALRNISEYVVRPAGYTSSDAEIRVYSLHLKAGSGTDDKTKRLAEATILRNHMNALEAGSSFMVAGDYNIRASTEAAYQRLVGSAADNDGRVLDPINRPGTWHDSYTFRDIHTQSPRTTAFGGGATGGMDDRFDLILVSYALNDGEGLDYIPGTYTSYGNDGMHLNTAINSGTNYAVSAAIADALHEAADHLPVYADFQLPAKLSAPTELAFGSYIAGTASALPLTVGNIAIAPADELDYSLAAPSGFSTGSGLFELEPGTEDDHSIMMDTATVGYRSGSLVISSDDVDHALWSVALSGTVLSHAAPSLVDGSVALLGSLDFGSHEAGGFGPQTLDVYNDGFTALRALLEVYDAEITGGDGRFFFDGGFSTQTAGSMAATYDVMFDSDGASPNTFYEAELVIHTRDDPAVSGSTTLSQLQVSFSAFVEDGTGIDDTIARLAFTPGAPNPFAGSTTFRLALPHPAAVEIAIFDIAGRLVATLESATLPAGDHEFVWNGRSRDGAPAASGVYVCRARAGEWESARKVVLLR
ncbi:choice-of-anchor D domain-containing protein [bacterium]|nr:choice-of-anchor D domain-containing protein [bacterium]